MFISPPSLTVGQSRQESAQMQDAAKFYPWGLDKKSTSQDVASLTPYQKKYITYRKPAILADYLGWPLAVSFTGGLAGMALGYTYSNPYYMIVGIPLGALVGLAIGYYFQNYTLAAHLNNLLASTGYTKQ